MAASGFGRDAGPLNRGQGSTPLAFGAGAAAPSPSPAAPPVPVRFPSAHPVGPTGITVPRFPSTHPQLAASYRPSATAPIPIPLSSVRPDAALGASGSVRFPSSLPAMEPGAAAATAPHVARHIQPQPRLAASSVSRPVNPVISSRSRSPSHISNQLVDRPAEYDNGMGQRRLVNYADPLFESGSAQVSEQMRMQHPEIGKTARSPPSNITSRLSPPSSLQNNPPVQIAKPRGHEHKPNLSPSKYRNQNQATFQDARIASSHLLNSNLLVTGSGRLPASFQSRTLDHNISKRSRSPTLSYGDVNGAEAHYDTGANATRFIDYKNTLVDHGKFETSKRMRSPSPEFTNMIKSTPSDIRGNIRSSPVGFGSNGAAQNISSHADIRRSNASLPKDGSQIQSHVSDVRSPPHLMSHLSDTSSNEHYTPAVSPPKPLNFSASKRTGTHPLDAGDDDHVFLSTELEREKQAKAKRLARFNIELSRPVENINDVAKAHNGNADKQKQPSSTGNVPIGLNDGADERTLTDADFPGLAAILGLCSDMCPEPERAERERKGDLDRYERLGGDRNQTTELLAVKKYNRTAERDADLIRPLPVLQKTMAYLLSLLDRTYDDSFLGLYNFLWDRMRAIRMDLRMQHFFNQEAINMLEQMIRLHIVAMHELCEYNKGEGFAEGFDAHLNIEQMNKTSVELFQMYDDHRRKGVLFSTEKEFRGYYALLKLDKHPGYKVEPAELSLDLAKMSREIRGSPDILVAREVARACRIGNYIAFFRLARKATYLQACLMHAHFAKLRRQALASLHSGLQISQGIPISHVVEWLAMEDEDIESLLEYHGFGLRQYEEPYLVKEGPFLNSESDFPSGCSQLVHSKKSHRVINDVLSGPVCAPTSQKEAEAPYSGVFASPVSKRELVSQQSALVIPVNAKKEFGSSLSGSVSPTSIKQTASQYTGLFSPNGGNKQFNSAYLGPISPPAARKEIVPVFPSTDSPSASKQAFLHTGLMDDQRVASPKPKGKTKVANTFISENPAAAVEEFLCSKPYDQHINAWSEPVGSHPLGDNASPDYSHTHGQEVEFRPHGSGSVTDLEEGSSPYHDHEEYGYHSINNKIMNELLPIVVSDKEKIPNERLKMILRKWQQRAADKRSLREQKNALAIAALNSLSLGPPVHQTAVVPKHAFNELDIAHAFKERYERHQRSWSPLNVSELAGPILTERKPDARCFCWKMLVLAPPSAMESQIDNFASKWLLKKLMGSGNEDGGLLFTSADSSIWTAWISSPNACCLSVVRASNQQVIGQDIAKSTSCIVFMVSESIPWEIQKARLVSLLVSVPDQAKIPLLILSVDAYNEEYDSAAQNVIDRLGVSGLSDGKIASSLVVFLVESHTEGYANAFFDDDKLREGLKWLANNLPLQPDVILVKTRELLMNYLNPSLELLKSRDAAEVGPEHCISVFNGAVDQLTEEIMAAAYTDPNQWPPHEIDHLERLSSERRFAEMFLPSIGWSSPSKVQPLVETIESCKLPEFSYDLSWLKQGSSDLAVIEEQALLLKECLTKYLTQSARLLNGAQAVAEANIMVQRSVNLEQRESYHYLVPRWATIFRRIYNWRLSKLATGEFSEAHVLSQRMHQAHSGDSNGAATLQRGLADTAGMTSILEHHTWTPPGPSLDEMIMACFYPEPAVLTPPAKPLPPPLPAPSRRDEPQATMALVDDEGDTVRRATIVEDTGMIPRRAELRDLVPAGWDADLVMLEEKVSEVQDRNAKQLYIYF